MVAQAEIAALATARPTDESDETDETAEPPSRLDIAVTR
jgi:hypothetical protein